MANTTVSRAEDTRRGLNITLWVLQIFTALGFFLAGASKMFFHLHIFDEIGWGMWFQYLTGVLEMAGAIGLVLRRLSGLAAAALVALSVVAVVFHILVLVESTIPILVLGTTSAVVAWGRRRTIVDLLQSLSGRR